MEEYDYMDELETEIDSYKLRIRKLLEEKEDYKSRIDKAIERLTLNGDIQEKDVIEVFSNAIRDTRNILNGGDE